MRGIAGYWTIAVVLGLAGFAPSLAHALPSYRLAEKCADASGFTARAMKHPDYKFRKVHATPKELAFMNRCIDATLAKRTSRKSPTRAARGAQIVRGKLPLPSQFPLMSGDTVLWPRMSMVQQRRAMQFLQTGSTILSSLQRD
jgi:hypothetical protein